MKTFRSSTLIIAFLFAATIAPGGPVAAASNQQQSLAVLTEYFELVAGGAYDIASDMWTPESLERSARFGIQYDGIPIKTDCNSPVMRNLDEFQSAPVAPIRKYEGLRDSTWYKLEYADIRGHELVQHDYYLQSRGDWCWLGWAQDVYAADWPITESRYFRFHADPEVEQFINPVLLDEADKFVENTAGALGIDAAMLAEIARAKIEYFYCASDSVIEMITGHRTRGMLDLPSNDILSADLPHFHEVTHLLMNIKLQHIPLFTMPLLREGAAVYYGGRWGKHPAVLVDLAVEFYTQDLVDFNAILTMRGYEQEAGANIVSPLAGLFTGYLIDRIGLEAFFELYRSFSGDFQQVYGLSVSETQGRMATATGQADWPSLLADFESYMKEQSQNHTIALPGSGEGGAELLSGTGFTVYDYGDWLGFEFVAKETDTLAQGNLLFGRDDNLVGLASLLFDNHYEDRRSFEGFRYGVRYDQGEVGLYDYGSNQLIAKYIWGIEPSDEYFDASSRKIAIRFKKSLLNGTLPGHGGTLLLSN